MKIETLKIDDNNPIGDDEETELNEDGEKVRVKKSDGGPWNKIAGQAGGKNDEDPDSRPSSPGMFVLKNNLTNHKGHGILRN